MNRRTVSLLAGIIGIGLVGCSVDQRQANTCRQFIAAFEHDTDTVEERSVGIDPADPLSMRIEYAVPGEHGDSETHWIHCRFAGRGLSAKRLTITGVATDRTGELNARQLQMLRIWQRATDPRGRTKISDTAKATGQTSLKNQAFLIQQIINAAVPSSIYALVAIGFSLVYRVVGRINLALGDFATAASLALFVGSTVAAAYGAEPMSMPVLIAVAVGVAASWGTAVERVVFRPLRAINSQAALIASLGLAMALREAIRLGRASTEFWFEPRMDHTFLILWPAQFSPTMTLTQLLLVSFAACQCAFVVLLIEKTGFGRSYRALSDDPKMAALIGVPVDRIINRTFVLAASCAGVAGVMTALYYGTISAYDGLILGLKALIAAVVGGLGSVYGGIVGGIFVGLLESFWSAYINTGTRDLALFGVLVATLVLRPQGILGRSGERGD